ncbi:MAG: ferredoxin--NADP reductase [Shewanella sp.]
MWTRGRVIERIDWNDKLFSLRIAADLADFIPGQFIKLSQVQGDKRVARAYSLVNSPDKPYAEVLAVAVEEGLLSPQLQHLGLGDEIDISPTATGFMTLEEIPKNQGQHLWLLATGTAIGPFLSILDTPEPWQRFARIALVYGVREAKDLAYLNKLRAYEARYGGQFSLCLAVTREPYPGALACRIPDGLTSGEIEQHLGLQLSAQDSQVMICGNPGMIADAQTALMAKGLAKNLRRAPGQITVEKYW